MKMAKSKLYRYLSSLGMSALLIFGMSMPALGSDSVYLNAGDGYLVGPLPEENIFSELDRSMVSPEAQKENTIMVYMVGTNLEQDGGYGTDDLMDMAQSGFDPAKTNVIVYTGGCAGWQSDIPNDKGSVLKVTPDGVGIVTTTYGMSDTGNPKALTDFVNFATDYFPASHYGLVLWDHGGGPLVGFGHDDFYISEDLGSGWYNNDGLICAELQNAMAQTAFSGSDKLDFVLFNACLIASVEMAQMWEPYADYLVASEESISGLGVPYDFLSALDSASMEELPKYIVDSYEKYYEKNNLLIPIMYPEVGTLDATLSCIDLSTMTKVSTALDQLFEKACDGLRHGQYPELQRLREQMYEFAPEVAGTEYCYDLVDCMDMAEELETLYPEEAGQLKDAIREAVVYATSNVERAHGLMLYYPDHSAQMEMAADLLYGDLVVSEGYRNYLSMVETIRENGDADYWRESEPEPEPEPEPAEEPEVVEEPVKEPEVVEEPSEEPEAVEEPSEEPEAVEEPSEEPEVVEEPSEEPEVVEEPVEEPEVVEEPSEEPEVVEEPSGEPAITWEIPEELSSYAAVSYSIYQENGDGSYRPILRNASVTPDVENKVQIPDNVRVLCLTSDQTSVAIPWPATEISRSGGTINYRVNDTIMAAGPEFVSVTEEGQPFVTMMVSVNEADRRAKIKTIKPVREQLEAAGFDDIDLSDWEGVYVALNDYEPDRKEDGSLRPDSDWTRVGNYLYRYMPIERQMGFSMRKLSELGEDYVCVISVKDSLGNIHCSDFLPFTVEVPAEFSSRTLNTDDGVMTFAVYSDHAELQKYEGTDSYLEIPDTVEGIPVTAIAGKAIRDAETVQELVISDNVRVIGENACAYMTALSELTLPAGLKRIEYHAFYADSSLTEVAIPQGCEVIGRAAFQGCEELEEVTLPDSLTDLGHAVFAECPALYDITVGDGCEACVKDSNLLLSKDRTILLAVPEGAGTYVKVPEGVETIAYGAFSGAENIKMVELPSTLTRIENFAFYNCIGLVNLTLPDSLEYIGTKAFGASTLTLSGDYDRAAIDSVQLGAAVRHVGTNAFDGLDLTSIQVAEGNRTWSSRDGFLTNAAGDTIFETPAGLTGTLTVPEGITTLRERLFVNYQEVTDFVLPDSLQRIPEACFPVSGYDTSSGAYVPEYDITLHCSDGSEAAAYAERHGITHKAD